VQLDAARGQITLHIRLRPGALNPDRTHPPSQGQQRDPLDIRLHLIHRPSVERSHLTASLNRQAALINDIHHDRGLSVASSTNLW
jgi:hypothetical protein